MISRSFGKKVYMKKVLLLIIILLVASGIYWFQFKSSNSTLITKDGPLKAKKHSQQFNTRLDTMLSAYFNLKNAFVNADTLAAKQAAHKFLSSSDSLQLDELKKDTSGIAETAGMQLNDIKTNAESLLKQQNITDMRQDFRGISENVYPLLKTIHYEGKTLYWQNCPMAFGEGKEANWISNTAEIINPYMGKFNPEFKSGMLHCGETKDSIKAF